MVVFWLSFIYYDVKHDLIDLFHVICGSKAVTLAIWIRIKINIFNLEMLLSKIMSDLYYQIYILIIILFVFINKYKHWLLFWWFKTEIVTKIIIPELGIGVMPIVVSFLNTKKVAMNILYVVKQMLRLILEI